MREWEEQPQDVAGATNNEMELMAITTALKEYVADNIGT